MPFFIDDLRFGFYVDGLRLRFYIDDLRLRFHIDDLRLGLGPILRGSVSGVWVRVRECCIFLQTEQC
jgi:hypothetical protein